MPRPLCSIHFLKVCVCVCLCRSQKSLSVLVYCSPSIPLKQCLPRNLRLVFSGLGWKPASFCWILLTPYLGAGVKVMHRMPSLLYRFCDLNSGPHYWAACVFKWWAIFPATTSHLLNFILCPLICSYSWDTQMSLNLSAILQLFLCPWTTWS